MLSWKNDIDAEMKVLLKEGALHQSTNIKEAIHMVKR